MVVWLADPTNNFEDGVWYDLSTNGLSLETVSGQGNPALSTETPSSGLFNGQTVSSLLFSNGVAELMHVDSGRSTFSDLTAVAVYRTTALDGNTRPFGVGSNSSDSPVPSSTPHMNLGTDPSIRKDNGSLSSHSLAHPLNELFVRTIVFDSSGSGSIAEYFDGTQSFSSTVDHYTVNSGDLFLGDVRNSNSPGDLSVAEIILFDRALSPTEISGLQEYLVANITSERIAPRPVQPPDPPQPTGTSLARPNILLIVTDDHGSIDLNCFGATDLSTPNLDGLAAGGIKFNQFTVASAVCSPSRGAFLTGRTPKANGVTGNAVQMPSSEFTMAELAKARDYHTALFGKWHLGETDGEPLRHGFDTFYGFLKGTIENYEHDRLSWGPATNDSYANRLNYLVAHDLWRDSTPITEDGTHFGDLIVHETNAFMETHRDEPFFIYAAFNTPHYPVQPFQSFYDSYPGLPEPRRSYAALVSTLDFQIGQILDKLDTLGLADDTIVIFFGDHGHSEESRTKMWNPAGAGNISAGGGDNGPYRGRKFQLWEGGIRVPAIVRWPRVLPANQSRDQLVTSMDWVPTLANLLGVDLPNRVDGRDILPVLFSPDAASPHSLNFYTQGSNWAVREGPWKRVRQSNVSYLYNLDTDIGENTDLDGANPGIADRLDRIYNAWIANPDANHQGIPEGDLAVSDLTWSSTAGSIHRDYDPSGTSILLDNGSFVSKGVSVAGDSSISVALGGLHSRFQATISHENSSPGGATVTFEVWGDGSLLYSSGSLPNNAAPVDLDLAVGGVQELLLVTTGSTGGPVAVWASARLTSSQESLSRAFQDANGRPSLAAQAPPASSPGLAATISVELKAVPNAEYYFSVSDELTYWREDLVSFSAGSWTIAGTQATIEEAVALGNNRWRLVFGLPENAASFARMKVRAVGGNG